MTTEQLTEIQEPTDIDVLTMLGKLGDLGRALTDDELNQLPPYVREQYNMAQALRSKLTSVNDVAGKIVGAFKDLIEQNGSLDQVDSFSINKAVDIALFAVVGEQPSQLLSPEYMRARKQTVQKIIQIILSERIAEDDPAKPNTRALVAALSSGLFGQSPSLMDYIGGMSDRLDVLADMSKTPELEPFYINQLGSIVYDMSFMDDRDVNWSVRNFVSNKTTAQQLLSLRLLEDVARYAYNEGYEPAEYLPDRICCALDDIDSDTMSFLPYRIMTTFINHVRIGEDDVDELAQYIIDDDKELAKHLRLGGQYQRGFTPTLLAKGLIGARSEYGIVEGAGAENDTGIVVPVDFMDALRNAGIDASDDDLLMFQELQRPEIKGYIEWQFGGIKLEELTLTAQFQLVRFASTRSFNDFCRLADTSSYMDERTRGDFLETFLALEFGDDFGDRLLNIAENIEPNRLAQILEILTNYRKLSKAFARWFEGHDADFANATEQAMNERLTDILAVIEQLSLKQNIDFIILGDIDFKENDIDKVIATMKDLETSLRLITDIVPDQSTKVNLINSDTSNFTAYRFTGNQGTVILYIRPQAALGYDPFVEYGKKGIGVEASISWLVNPSNPHDASWSKKDDKVSIRFDREGRLVSEDAFSEDRDPTRKDGSIALDISSLFGPDSSSKARIGRTVAAGNVIRSESGDTSRALHHNNHYFDQEKYGSEDGFAELAGYVQAMVRARIQESRASNHQKLGLAAAKAGPKSAA